MAVNKTAKRNCEDVTQLEEATGALGTVVLSRTNEIALS